MLHNYDRIVRNKYIKQYEGMKSNGKSNNS